LAFTDIPVSAKTADIIGYRP